MVFYFFIPVPKSCFTEDSQQIQYGKDFPVKKQTVCQILLQEERNRKILASAEHLQGGVSGTWDETSSCQHSCQ